MAGKQEVKKAEVVPEKKEEKPKADMSAAAKKAWETRKNKYGQTGISAEGTVALKEAAAQRKAKKEAEEKTEEAVIEKQEKKVGKK